MESENNKVRVKLERHMWPDEVKERSKRATGRIIGICLLILFFSCGYLLGFGSRNKGIISTNSQSDEVIKFNQILETMSEKWFFAKEDPEVVDHLLDDAYYAMTSQEVDPHTTYMSKDEVEAFTQSINMNFVGIGVQFYRGSDYAIVQKVFKNSPADKAGVLSGDIINKVDGQEITGKTSQEIADMVKGEADSRVTIEFLRQGEPISLEITRAEIKATTYGRMLDNGIGYLEMYQFGSSTSDEVYDYLNFMSENGMTKLIIDLRDNGGGYLDTLVHTLDYFLDDNTLVMQQEYPDGSLEYSKTGGNRFKNINKIVILINENTASASEVMTLALKEQRSDVTVIGKKSYGKGTVQITSSFIDGSAIKYTTSKWLSPSGVWVNKEGISPDIEVDLPKAITSLYEGMEDDEVLEYDSVSNKVSSIQVALDFLGYKVDRMDGYFDLSSKEALINFQKDYGLVEDGILNSETYKTIVSAVSLKWTMDKSLDSQLQKAVEVLNG